MRASAVTWVRFGAGAPVEPGVYLNATELAAWLRWNDEHLLAETVESLGNGTPTESLHITTVEQTAPAGAWPAEEN